MSKIQASSGTTIYDVKVIDSLHKDQDIFIQANNGMVSQQALHFSTENAYRLIEEIVRKSDLNAEMKEGEITVFAPIPDKVARKRREVLDRYYGSPRARINSIEEKLVEQVVALELEKEEK